MNSDFPHLDKAPIREAVLDIKVEPHRELTSEALEALFGAFADKVKDEFPEARPIRSLQAEFDVRGEAPCVRSNPTQTLGTICWNESKSRAVQGRLDGFTVNHVQGYESWPVLREQAQRLWSEYVTVLGPQKVTRCALRYINRIEFEGEADLSAGLLTRPEIGADLPQIVDDFFMRVVVPFPDGRKASLTQASEASMEAGVSRRGLILDIDAFSMRGFNSDDDAMWQEFDELRTIKNRCFFKSLSQATWEAFR